MEKNYQEINREEWLSLFRYSWLQGEHVVILGPTGTGKTFFSQPMLETRDFVSVLAVKPRDDTMERFKNGHKYGYSRYHLIKKWPPDHGYNRVVYWEKPEGLKKLKEQASRVHTALDTMYREGGWTIYLDDVGYIAGSLGMGSALGVLLNQGRSSGISVVPVVQRPTSLVQRIPKEAFSQPRHKMIFKYENQDELKAAAVVADMSKMELELYTRMLKTHYPRGYTDFLYVGKGQTYIVRNG